MKRIGVGTALVVIALAIGFFLFPKNDICTDKVRGYAQSASSAVEGAREALTKVSAALKTEQAYKAEQSFKDLKPADFAILRTCDTQCELLKSCLRFVVFSSPAQACPREYDDFQKQSKAASDLLTSLEQMRSKAAGLVPESDKISELREGIAELEKSSGSTGGQIAVLKQKLEAQEKTVTSGINELNQSIAAIAAPVQ